MNTVNRHVHSLQTMYIKMTYLNAAAAATAAVRKMTYNSLNTIRHSSIGYTKESISLDYKIALVVYKFAKSLYKSTY